MLVALLSLATLAALSPPHEGQRVFVRPPLAVFQERTSVRPGERIEIYARSEVGNARLEVVEWRGGARLLKPRDVEIPGPSDRPNEATIGCAWRPCTTIQVPDDARSGVYLVRLSSADGTAATAPLVVRAARPGERSRALVLHPEAALAAANEWGGASFFATAHGPPVSAVALDRPLFGERVGAVANGAFLDWLDALDFAVEHASDLDLARDETLLDPYDLVLFPHHHPYWTAEMRAAVDAFVRNGGRILILGGGFGTFQARLEDRGRTLRAHVLPELDPWYADTRAGARIAGPFAHGPVNDPEERSFGLASRHAYLGFPRADGFGYLRAHAPDHPFLRDVGVAAEGLFGRTGAGERLHVAVAGASDGANLERLDGVVLAGRAAGAPVNLRVLATAPASDGFACVAEHHGFGSVAHFGSDAIAREAFGAGGGNGGGGMPDVQTLLASALWAYAPPRRSLIRNGGFERWTRFGEAWVPVGFEVAGAPEPVEVGGGDDALAAGDGRKTSVWQHVRIPRGDVHLIAWTSTNQSAVRLDVGNGFVLARAEPAGWSERHGGYRYARATVEEAREAYLTCELPARRGGLIDLVEVVPESAWRRELELDWRVLALGSGERLSSAPIVLDAGSTYLVTVVGFGKGEVRIPEWNWSWRTSPSPVSGEIGVGVLPLTRPGESVRLSFELRAETYLTDVEVNVFPLNAASPAPTRERAVDMGAPGDWELPADEAWEVVAGVVDHAVELVDEEIAIAARVPGEPSRITLWTRGMGTLEIRLVEERAGVLFRAQVRAGRDRWTPHLVRLEQPPRTASRLELHALGPVQVDRVRLGSERLALRDDHLPNGAFELVPAPLEAAHDATDWHDRPPGWSVAGGALFLDPVEPRGGDHSLVLEPHDGRATALLRVPDPLRLDRAWRATLAARVEPGTRSEIKLLAAWPGDERRFALASAWLAERTWTDVSLGATVAELADALDALRAPHRRPGATALAWIELTAEGGRAWIDDLTLDVD